jgi:hypothetical protein
MSSASRSSTRPAACVLIVSCSSYSVPIYMYISDLFAACPAEAKDCVGEATGFASSASGSLVPKQKSKVSRADLSDCSSKC